MFGCGRPSLLLAAGLEQESAALLRLVYEEMNWRVRGRRARRANVRMGSEFREKLSEDSRDLSAQARRSRTDSHKGYYGTF
jgi:hypothetical protein